MTALEAIRRVVERLSRWLTLVGAYMLLAAALVICADVFLRRFAGTSVHGADELSGYALAISTAWALAYAFYCKSHIRIDVIHRILPIRTRTWLDVLGTAMLFGLAILLCYFGGRELITSISYSAVANTTLRVPLWIPQSLWVSGLVLFAIATGFALVEAVLRLVNRDHRGIETVVGTAHTANL